MSSMIKITSNRLNAQRSTGPKTPAGKKHARLNALTSGIYATTHILPGEPLEEYEVLRRSLTDGLKPQGVMEEFYVDQILTDMWKLKRIDRGEIFYLTPDIQWQANRRAETPRVRNQRGRWEKLLTEYSANREFYLDMLQKIEEASWRRNATPAQEDVDTVLAQSVTDEFEDGVSEKFERRRCALRRAINQNLAFLMSLQERRPILVVPSNEISEKNKPANDAGLLEAPAITETPPMVSGATLLANNQP
jgi:hypothetical protein